MIDPLRNDQKYKNSNQYDNVKTNKTRSKPTKKEEQRQTHTLFNENLRKDYNHKVARVTYTK